MDKTELKRLRDEAWQEVMAHPAADMRRFLSATYSSEFKRETGDKVSIKKCPLCQGDGCSVLMKQSSGHYLFQCRHSSCSSGDTAMGIAKFIEHTHGCDWKQARKILHDITGVPDPWDSQQGEYERSDKPEPGQAPAKDESPEVMEEIDAPVFIKIPETDRNVYEEAWTRLTLTEAHRKELRTKRGLPDSWIDALGFRSSTRANRAALEPILEMFPPNELLRAGMASRQSNDWKKLRLADQLCGRSYEEDENGGEGMWVDKDMIIIPYIDGNGRIVSLRPHKKNLGSKNFRKDEASEFYEKNHHSLSMVYGEHFLINRPEKHAHRCVIGEGEFKADAVAFCGIPAIGFPGITFLRNNHETGQAITYVVEMLRRHKIREVIIVFDNEDKANKPVKKPRDRWIAEIHARNTALILENHGFKVLYGMLPDEWMEGAGTQPEGWFTKGKADWDGRLAWHLRKARNSHAKARATAADEFEKFLANRKGRNAVMPVPRQMDWQASHKEDVIWQELNRLQFEPDCFPGGKHEIEVAAEITGYCHRDYRDLLNIEQLAQALRKTCGGYYTIRPPAEKLELRVIDAKKEILWMLEQGTTKPDKAGNTTDLTDDDIRALRAALLACNTILYKMPKPFSDFTIISHYKVLVTEPDGTTRKDRLCVFVDSNGRKSKPMQVSWDRMSSAQEARKVFLKIDGLHFRGGQTEIDAMVPTIDVNNYQQTIIEIDTYGYDRESGLVLLGDCALAQDEKGAPFLFPDYNGIIWYRGMGYKNSESLATFCHKPPMLFPGDGKPKQVYQAIDWDKERKEVDLIFAEALQIAQNSFGDLNGYIMVAGLLQYLAHPETLDQIPGRPGLWVQGAKGSGKTQTIMAFMRMLGYVQNFGTIGLTGTKVGIERSLSQFDSLPVHIDEWRNARASDELVGFVTNAFNGLSIAKGTQQGSKSIRQSRAATIPVVTGEDMTTDTALLSRYIRLTMSASARTGTPQEQRDNFNRMQELSGEFYRIGRYLMRQRREFSKMVIESARAFISDGAAMDAIRDPRARECTAIAFSALDAAFFFIAEKRIQRTSPIGQWFLTQGRRNSEEIEKDIFRLRWFSDCVGLITGHVDREAERYLQVRRGTVLPDGSVNILKGNQADVMLRGQGRLLILVAWSELSASHRRDLSRQNEKIQIDVRNIRQELSREPYWIPAPKKGNGCHNFTVEGFRPKSWWVMDYDSAGDLRHILSTIYERTLYAHDLELDEDGNVGPLDGRQEPLGI